MRDELKEKDANIEAIAARAAEDDELLRELLQNLWEKEEILRFAHSLLDGESPKTRKLAKQFLEKWDG